MTKAERIKLIRAAFCLPLRQLFSVPISDSRRSHIRSKHVSQRECNGNGFEWQRGIDDHRLLDSHDPADDRESLGFAYFRQGFYSVTSSLDLVYDEVDTGHVDRAMDRIYVWVNCSSRYFISASFLFLAMNLRQKINERRQRRWPAHVVVLYGSLLELA